jgi:hypothetical protein
MIRRRRFSALLVALGALLAACSTSSGTAIPPPDADAYGPPPGATEVRVQGTNAIDGVMNLTFVGSDGHHYLVHTGSSPFFPIPADPARVVTTQRSDGTTLTLMCAGTMQAAVPVGQPSAVDQIAGPLVISWPAGDAVVTAMSQDDTGPCAPTATSAAPLLGLVASLPRISGGEWAQLLREHPLALTGDSSDSAVGSSSTAPN